MITEKSIDKYKEMFPEDECFYGEPSSLVYISHGEDTYGQPEDETNDIFMDRLVRCKKAGRNLFLEEWDVENIEEDVDY